MIQRFVAASFSLLLFSGCQQNAANSDIPKVDLPNHSATKALTSTASNDVVAKTVLPAKEPPTVVQTREPTRQEVIEKVFGGAFNFALMQSSPVVQACLLKRKDAKGKDRHALSNYEEGPFVELSPAQANALRTALGEKGTYRFDISKFCRPIFGVRIRFSNQADSLDVNFCFECDILVVAREGSPVGGEDFDAARPALVALCKDLFPDDPEIQKLRPK